MWIERALVPVDSSDHSEPAVIHADKFASSPAELSRIRKTASKVLEESGQIEDAVSLLREDGEWEGLARVIEAHARHLIRQGRGQTMSPRYPARNPLRSGWLRECPKIRMPSNCGLPPTST